MAGLRSTKPEVAALANTLLSVRMLVTCKYRVDASLAPSCRTCPASNGSMS
jgi:hypothetical protein